MRRSMIFTPRQIIYDVIKLNHHHHPLFIFLFLVSCHSVHSLLSFRLLAGNLKVKIHKTVILPVAFYECETWSLTLREEHRLRVFENRVLRRIFGPKRDEVTGEWRK
jgi:hypothetical protein